MPRLDEVRDELIGALDRHFGRPTSSAPGPEAVTPFERLAWVALRQVANPQSAAAAFDALDDAGMLEPGRLGPANPLVLDDILKRAKVAVAIKSLRPLQKLARWAADRDGPFTAEFLATTSTAAIRAEWREINGIGLATADTLLLEGLARASYPVDRATYRILVRHGWLDPSAEYDEAREVMDRLGRLHPHQGVADGGGGGDPAGAAAVAVLLDLSRWFDRVGRESCKVAVARCERCPLRPWLPPDGPVEVE